VSQNDRKPLMRTHRWPIVTAAATLLMAAGVAACSGTGSSTAIGSGSTASTTGQKIEGGTATIPWVAATPNFIFPLVPATNSDGYNVNLTDLMWPNLVYEGDGGQSTVNPQESLYNTLTYSDDDKTVTIDLKPWQWSDGTPITSRDFSFTYNLLKANVPNWQDYVQGLFPDDVKSVQTPNSSTIILNLTQSYNPAFFTEDVLGEIPLLPQHAWDKESATGKVGSYDETKSGAKAVYAFLQKEGGDIATFATNPLWQVVDGPWKLKSFSTDGEYVYVPNKGYSGPDKPTLAEVVNEPFTTDTAEFDALRSGSSLTVGGLPQEDLRQIPELKAGGYDVATQPIPGESGIFPNFYSSQVGAIVSQLYVRQALEDLINRPQIVSKVYDGYADPENGPIPVQGFSSLLSPLEKSGGPYPYDPSKAIALLKGHGWTVTPNGTTTCADPGTGATECGAGVAKGAALSFQLLYSSGSTSNDEEFAAIQSSEEQAGIKISLKSEPFNTLVSTVGVCNASSHPASTCGWQLVYFGYEPYGLYPAGDGIFNTGGTGNQGGYSSAEEDKLINETEFGSSAQTFFAYEDYTAEQLPQLWVPLSSNIQVYKSTLANYAPLNPFSGGLNPEDWYFTK
jgi:peptide/nickel transport system substrate-binding protein